MSDSKIVSLKGENLAYRFEPSPDVIEKLEWLLEAAKSGEVLGIAGVLIYRDEATATFRCGMSNYAMVGRIDGVKAKMIEGLT